jgi:hypothetical protein
MAAADTLAVSMKPPYFTRVSTGPGNLFGAEFFSWMNGGHYLNNCQQPAHVIEDDTLF